MKIAIRNVAIVTAFALACSSERTRPAPQGESSAAASGDRPPSPAPLTGSYIGTQYVAPPPGVTILGGAAFSTPGDTRGTYALAYVQTPHGSMIWLDTIDGGTMRVRAQLSLPALAIDERLFIGTCDVAGHLNGRVVAIALNEVAGSRFDRIRQAWLANTEHHRFDIVPVSGVTCEDDSASRSP